MKVFRLIIGGKRTSDIAEQLFVSKETVSSHRKRIIQKTSSKTPLDMYLLASKFQLTEL
jgi:DNA-binding CsgD family transcriptional regulator